jgi:hypothetical protein
LLRSSKRTNTKNREFRWNLDRHRRCGGRPAAVILGARCSSTTAWPPPPAVTDDIYINIGMMIVERIHMGLPVDQFSELCYKLVLQSPLIHCLFNQITGELFEFAPPRVRKTGAEFRLIFFQLLDKNSTRPPPASESTNTPFTNTRCMRNYQNVCTIMA